MSIIYENLEQLKADYERYIEYLEKNKVELTTKYYAGQEINLKSGGRGDLKNLVIKNKAKLDGQDIKRLKKYYKKK